MSPDQLVDVLDAARLGPGGVLYLRSLVVPRGVPATPVLERGLAATYHMSVIRHGALRHRASAIAHGQINPDAERCADAVVDLSSGQPVFLAHRREHLSRVNERLRDALATVAVGESVPGR